jgi:hypothetical protein
MTVTTVCMLLSNFSFIDLKDCISGVIAMLYKNNAFAGELLLYWCVLFRVIQNLTW